MIVALLIAFVASSAGQKPKFGSAFQNVTMETGFTQRLNCKAEGEEPITYKWYNQKEEEITTNDEKQPVYIKNYTSLLQSSLYFKRPGSEHEGSYTCTASNAHGLASKVFSVKVSPPSGLKPEFDSPFRNVTKQSGKFQWLKCEAKGEKPMKYKWYNQNDEEITEKTPNVSLTIYELYSDLNFKNLSTKQQGKYTCTASNVNGQASKVFFLTVSSPEDKDNGTSQLRGAKVLDYTSNSVKVYINTTGPVKYIEVKYRESKQAKSTTKRLNPVSGNSYEIGNLLPSGSYSFQFRTLPPESNVWSKEYNVTLFPEAPDIILENVNNQNVKLQWFRKKEDIVRGTIDKHRIKYYEVRSLDGNKWTSKDCTVTVEVPTCMGSSYTIWGLNRTIFYQIEVRAHTKGGYGLPWMQKVYLP